MGLITLDGCYAFAANEWTPFPSLPQPCYHTASVVLGDNFYVIGGEKDYRLLKEVYRYNTISKQWYTETPMDDVRTAHSAAALSDTELIVCGGYAQPLSRHDCTIYSTTTQRWTRTGDLNQDRHYFAMVVFGGDVYALGGVAGGWMSSVKLDTVEVYDRATNSWKMVDKKLKDVREGFVGIVV